MFKTYERLQSSQVYGRSPVCVRWCNCNRKTRLNPRPQWRHLWGFSPVCVLQMRIYWKAKFYCGFCSLSGVSMFFSETTSCEL